MARKKKFIPTPPAMLKLTPNKPTRIERGVVVQLRDSQGKLMKSRGIVMGHTPSTNYTRAYGREVYVCEVDPPRGRGNTIIVRDAIESRNKVDIERAVTATTFIHEKNATGLKPIGRVKRIPKVCILAMKIEKGTF